MTRKVEAMREANSKKLLGGTIGLFTPAEQAGDRDSKGTLGMKSDQIWRRRSTNGEKMGSAFLFIPSPLSSVPAVAVAAARCHQVFSNRSCCRQIATTKEARGP